MANDFQFTQSQALFEEAVHLLPGGVDSPARACKAVGVKPLFMERGKGAYLYDVDGNRYLDYVLSFGPLILGHASPQVTDAIQRRLPRARVLGHLVRWSWC